MDTTYLPDTTNTSYLSLSSQLSFSSYFTSYTSYFTSEGLELVHHGIDCILQLEDFSFGICCHLLGKISIGYGSCYLSDSSYLACKIGSHSIYIIGQILPDSFYSLYVSLSAKFSFCSYF